jgi:hypothetical protein
MKRYVEFPLESSQGSVVVEVTEPEPEGGIQRAARPGDLAVKAGQTFESALDKVKPIAAAVLARLRGLGDALTEVAVEFELKFSAHAGLIVASGGVDANFKVSLKWKREGGKETPPA